METLVYSGPLAGRQVARDNEVPKPKEETKMDSKPTCKLIGTDGNVFSIIGLVSKSLKKAGMDNKAKEFTEKAFKSGSYDAVLCLCSEYVEIK